MTITSNGYQSGFGNEFATEAVAGSLPEGRNSPQRVAHGLYAEQLSGTAFTAPRHANRRSWLYRIRPAAMHGPFEAYTRAPGFHNDFGNGPLSPDQLRWSPMPLPTAPVDFVDGLFTMAGNGSPAAQAGVGIHLYAANRDMQGRFFYDADGELLIVPQQGRLHIATELGVIDVEPQEIAVIPRGVRFAVSLPDGQARGYICENFGAMLRLPDLGPIGSRHACAELSWAATSSGASILCRLISWISTASAFDWRSKWMVRSTPSSRMRLVPSSSVRAELRSSGLEATMFFGRSTR